MAQFELYHSIAITIHGYIERHGKAPDKIFMSNQAFHTVGHGRPYRLAFHEDRNVTFMGIPVERYEAPGIEYHLAERGDVW